jgi:hypothetical protein
MDRKNFVLIGLGLFLIPFLLVAQPSGSIRDHLMRTHETAGVNFQMQSITPEKGEAQNYNVLAIPLQIRYEHSRYFSLTFRMNQGQQSYGGNGLYSLGDLSIGARYLSGENWTFIGGVTLPTGTKELDYDQLIATSAGRLPFINAPVTFGVSGFGMHIGGSYGQQPNEKTSLAIGILYRSRGEYAPVEGGEKYDPSDVFMIAGGVEYQDGEDWGLMFDFQLINYSKEKFNGEEIADACQGVALSGYLFSGQWKLMALYYHRDKSTRKYAGDFVPPSILNLKLAYRGGRPFVPYVGVTSTGEGTLVEKALLTHIGFYFEGLQWNRYPMNPYVEINFGSIGDKTKTSGFKIGTDISFQMY